MAGKLSLEEVVKIIEATKIEEWSKRGREREYKDEYTCRLKYNSPEKIAITLEVCHYPTEFYCEDGIPLGCNEGGTYYDLTVTAQNVEIASFEGNQLEKIYSALSLRYRQKEEQGRRAKEKRIALKEREAEKRRKEKEREAISYFRKHYSQPA